MALVLVTGASTGLGLETATTLAASGHDVVLHARNAGRIEERSVLDQMRAVVYGDLSQLDETVQVAERANAIGRFDAVIHNAGVMRSGEALAVNVVAPYTLTALMTRPARTIVLSSSMHLSGRTSLHGFSDGAATYEDSKLYVTAFAMALAVRWPEVMAHAVDPGWVPTRMGGASAPDSLAEGHRTQEWLATAPDSEIQPRTGAYWYHGRPRRPHPAATDRDFQMTLIETLEAHTGISLPGSKERPA